MNKERIKSISLIVAIAIAITCALGWIVQATLPSKPTMQVIPEITNSQVQLSAARASGSTTEYTLTATIRPDGAENQAVDWSIAWQSGTPLENEEVTNYVTVTPSSDGALTAKVKCVQPFYGSTAIVTVTTREGGFTATAKVTFDGAPTELTVNNGNNATQKITETGTYAISMNNVFGYVGDKYKSQVFVESVTIGGTYTGCELMFDMVNETGEINFITNNVDITKLKDYSQGESKPKSFKDCLSVSVWNDSVVVSFTGQLGFMGEMLEEQSGFLCIYNAFYGDLNAYADITVRCNLLTATFRVNLTAGVYGVSLDMAEIAF